MEKKAKNIIKQDGFDIYEGDELED